MQDLKLVSIPPNHQMAVALDSLTGEFLTWPQPREGLDSQYDLG